jgi:tetratricopeptide (TPR) repeat protein
VIGLQPANAVNYSCSGQCKKQLHDFPGAIADLNKAIKLDPKFAQAYSYRAQPKIHLLNKKGACADWQKAVQLGDMSALRDFKENCK